MKQILKAVLTMMMALGLLPACRTASTVERRTEHVENKRTAKADSVALHTADSVLVLVERGDSLVRIIERTVHTREKVKVVRDTVVVYVQNDSIVKKEAVKEKSTRSPPRWKRTLAILGLLVIVLVAIKLLTILKHFKL